MYVVIWCYRMLLKLTEPPNEAPCQYITAKTTTTYNLVYVCHVIFSFSFFSRWWGGGGGWCIYVDVLPIAPKVRWSAPETERTSALLVHPTANKVVLFFEAKESGNVWMSPPPPAAARGDGWWEGPEIKGCLVSAGFLAPSKWVSASGLGQTGTDSGTWTSAAARTGCQLYQSSCGTSRSQTWRYLVHMTLS